MGHTANGFFAPFGGADWGGPNTSDWLVAVVVSLFIIGACTNSIDHI